MLEYLGMAIGFVIGAFLGATIMYVGELIMDWREDRDEERQATLD